MGAFFTNFLAKTTELDGVAAAMQRMAADDGWSLVENAESTLVRSIVCVPAGQWIAVYDQATEIQDVGLWSRLAIGLAGELAAPVLATLVHDSDFLDLRLFDGSGNLLGFLYLGEETPSINEGRLEPWQAVFPKIHTVARQLAKSITTEQTFIEDTLGEVAKLLELPDAISTGYNYAARAGLPANARLLTFAPVEDPVADSPNIGTVHAESIELDPGAVGIWGATYRNFGAEARGLTVTISDLRHIARVEQIAVTIAGRSYACAPMITGDGQAIATFPEAVVPAGPSRRRLSQLKLLGGQHWWEAAMPPFIHLDVTLHAADTNDTVTLAARMHAMNGANREPALHAVGCTVGTPPPMSEESMKLLDAIFKKPT